MAVNPYMMIIGSVIVPVTPDKITTKYKGQNETVELVDGSVINKVAPPGLTTYSFTLLLPKQTNLPFANRLWVPYSGDKAEHMDQDYYLNYFYDIFKNNRIIVLSIWRNSMGSGEGVDISGDGIFTYKSVTIESYEIEEDAEEGMDMKLSLELQEYVGYGTRKIKYTENTDTGTATAATETTRETDNKEIPETYTVKSGDCLINICKSQLGDGNKWQEIARLNNLENANRIYPGQVLKLK